VLFRSAIATLYKGRSGQYNIIQYNTIQHNTIVATYIDSPKAERNETSGTGTEPNQRIKPNDEVQSKHQRMKSNEPQSSQDQTEEQPRATTADEEQRANYSNNNNNNPTMVRTRVDSDGSTRGAFYQHGPGRLATDQTNLTTKKSKKKKKRKSQALLQVDKDKEPPKEQNNDDTFTFPSFLSGIQPPNNNRLPTIRDISFTSGATDSESIRNSNAGSSSRYHGGKNSNDPRSSMASWDSLRYSLNAGELVDEAIPPHHSNTLSPVVGTHINTFAQNQQLKSISRFSAMAQSNDVNEFSTLLEYGALAPSVIKVGQLPFVPSLPVPFELKQPLIHETTTHMSWWDKIEYFLDPTDWLLSDLKHDDDGEPYFDESSEWNLAGWFRHLFYNPEVPEFTSLQQFSWAVILGVVMGVYTALWKGIISAGVHFVWNTIPSQLFLWGFFTDIHGIFPLPHYMWMAPTFFGGILSYIVSIVPHKIPGQNEWIHAIHSCGVQDYKTFWELFAVSTAGMSSGLSLGPELPLVLTSGMFGSYIGVLCKQSILQARVMNLTAASAAIAGFFGFPMAGALFVLEIPHRMGLQYFEALSPATIASIVAVLVNRIVTGDQVTGYYKYPFLTATLPSYIFANAIVYGIYGAAIGYAYVKGVMKLKNLVHSMFSAEGQGRGHYRSQGENVEMKSNFQNESQTETENYLYEETTPLFKKSGSERHKEAAYFIESASAYLKRIFTIRIIGEPRRAAVSGAVAGFLVGVICMFVPHVMFWGEAQLQTMIDKGRSPLPIFGKKGTPSAGLTAYGFCITDLGDETTAAAGFSMGCSALIGVSKIVVTGLSLGTGIVGGQFWGPLFTGCIASHFFTDFVNLISGYIGFGASLSAFPCVAILCVMGASHVVTYRAHLGIMLILTLTISAFDSGATFGNTGGDYSAIFPLLVVSVFVSLMLCRTIVFYGAQRSRGDIMAIGEVLCEPNKEGAPLVLDYEYPTSGNDSGFDSDSSLDISRNHAWSANRTGITQEDIERAFMDKELPSSKSVDFDKLELTEKLESGSPPRHGRSKSDGPVSNFLFTNTIHSSDSGKETRLKVGNPLTPSSRLDELLARPLEAPKGRDKATPIAHRKTASDVPRVGGRFTSGSSKSDQGSNIHLSPSGEQRLVQVASFGEISDYQPSLMDQARMRASSSVGVSHRRLPSLPNRQHSRTNSDASAFSTSMHIRNPSSSDASVASFAHQAVAANDAAGALPQDEIERNFSSTVMKMGTRPRG